ncbi:MAG: tetratricopeptide repeat protein [bacterium]|nr:tetratricopeptide repeat protein [bacterium]
MKKRTVGLMVVFLLMGLKPIGTAFSDQKQEGATATKELKEEIERSQQRSKWLETYIESVETQSEEKEKAILLLEKENKKLEKTNEALDKDYAVLEAKQRKLNEEKNRWEEEVKELRKDKDRLEKRMVKVTGEKETLENQIQQLETKMGDTLARKEEEIKNFRQQLTTQTETIHELNKKLAEVQGEVSNSQKKLEQAMLLKQIAEGEKRGDERRLRKECIAMHYKLALVYQKTDRYEEAEKEYMKVLSFDPNNSAVHYNMGILYDDHLRNNKKAVHYYQQYIKFSPNAKDVSLVKEWILRIQNKK